MRPEEIAALGELAGDLPPAPPTGSGTCTPASPGVSSGWSGRLPSRCGSCTTASPAWPTEAPVRQPVRRSPPARWPPGRAAAGGRALDRAERTRAQAARRPERRVGRSARAARQRAGPTDDAAGAGARCRADQDVPAAGISPRRNPAGGVPTRPRPDRRRVAAETQSVMCPTASASRPSSATRRSTSATTPAVTSQRTAGSWRGWSSNWSRCGPPTSRRSRSSGTRWAGCSPARHVTTARRCPGRARFGRSSCSAPLTTAPPWSSWPAPPARSWRRLPETTAVAKAIEQRSAGIKDLGRGYIVDEDWRDGRPHRARGPLPGRAPSTTSISSGDACAGGRCSSTRRQRLGAGAEREPVRFPPEHYAQVRDAGHFDLLNHPAVYAQIHRRLRNRLALPAPARALPPPS